MLELTISLADAAGPWAWSDGSWRSGASVIEPFTHPALETVARAADDVHRITIRERCPGQDGRPHRDDWPGDFVTVELGAGTVRVHAGQRGTAPLYLAADGRALHGSWDLARLRGVVSADRLDDREAARLLTLRYRYGHDTLFRDARRLTERSAAMFTDDGLTMHYPGDALHGQARALRPDADVIAGYDRLLRSAVAERSYAPDTTCAELSGGLDSANVAATLGILHPGRIAASAMILPGETGAQQAGRRADLIRHLRLGPGDCTVDFAGLLPFAPPGRRAGGEFVTPYEDLYDEAKTALNATVAAQGVRVVFTGIGGDEMVARTVAEHDHLPLGTGRAPMPWISQKTREIAEDSDTGIAPAAVVNEMTLTAQACAAPAFLRAGIWPVHPLAHPDLVRFGEWLPANWRRHKRLHRARLEAAGCPRGLLEPKLRENFTPVMRQALREHGLPLIGRMLRDGSPLIERGFIDPDGLASVSQRLAGGGEFRERESELYVVLTVDLALRALA